MDTSQVNSYFVFLLGGVALPICIGLILAFFRSKRIAANATERNVNMIAEVVHKQSQSVRKEIINQIATKLPQGISAEEFFQRFEQLLSNNGKNVKLETISYRDDSPSWKMVQDLVHGYHVQALSQARVQFWFSVMAATVGFALIIYMVKGVIGQDNLSIAMNTLPGTVIDIVAGLFFKQANETRHRATELYDRLRTDSQITQSLELVENISDGRLQSLVKAQISLHMAGLTTEDLNLIDIIQDISTQPKNL